MRLVICNCPPEQADAIANTLIERRLAACVNAIPGVRSTYVWEGRVCVDVETTLLIKTGDDTLDALTEALVDIHPYAVPEVLAIPISEGHQPYIDWVTQATRRREPDPDEG